MIHEPKLIILDDLLVDWDPVNTEVLKQGHLEEKERGATIIFSEPRHDQYGRTLR